MKRFNIIRSKLRSYYSDADIAQRWYNYWAVVNYFYQASTNYFRKDASVKEDLKEQVYYIENYFSSNKSVNMENLTTNYDRAQWQKVYALLFHQADEIIRDVLKLSIKAF